jgi:predicted nucleotidyltransferase
MDNATINKAVIKKISQALGDLNEQVIYVGGATVGLYINDPAADDVRPTKDVDISLSIASIGELEKFREELIKRGFRQTSGDSVVCRFRYEDLMVDVMNTKSIGWAPANVWFAPGFKQKETIGIEGQSIHLLPLPYFLATKFAAYFDRGKNEPRTSHDFEDIVYILDNRTDLVEIMINAQPDVKAFLNSSFLKILHEPVMQEAISGNLFYEMPTTENGHPTRNYPFGGILCDN